MSNYGPPNPPPEAYCPCCKRLSDCCICNAGTARYYGEQCGTCQPLANEKIVIEVIAPGSWVKLMDGLRAIVCAVRVGASNHVDYSVSWQDGSNVHQQWFEAFQISKDEGQPTFGIRVK